MTTNPTQYLYERDLLSSRVAERYRKDGYEVLVEPQSKDLPFDLGTYRPDLLVKKSNDGGYIIEIKNSVARVSVERYREVAEMVSDYSGWHFLLVTGDDSFPSEEGDKEQLLSWEEIIQRNKHSEYLVSLDEMEMAFLSLWTITEALMRKRAEQTRIPIERFPPMALIKHLYSQGELSIEQFDSVLSLLPIRNRVAHGYQTPELNRSVVKLQKLVNEFLNLWMPLPQTS